MIRLLQYLFLSIIVTTVGFSLYQWNASRASTQKTAPNNGLVGYWSFDEGTGTQAGDASGNNNTGTLTGGPTWVAGKLGTAINFDGVNDYVVLGSGTGEFTEYTVSLWYKKGSVNGVIFHRGRSNSCSYNPSFSISSSGWTPSESGCSSAGAMNTVSLPAGWNHLLMTRSGQTAKSYLNGVLQQTDTSQPSGGGIYRIVLGAGFLFHSPDTFGSFADGQIDEVRIYNRALSGTEVTNLYNLGAEKLNISPTTSLTSGLVGYWTFDGKDTPWTSSSAGTATDKSGNGNTGTLTNMSQSTSVIRGQLGQALNFDGIDDRVTVSSDVIGSGATSICTWVNPRSMGGGGYGRIVLSMNGATEKTALLMSYPAPLISFGSDGVNYISSNTIDYNRWIHVCATRDASGNGKIYLDGVQNVTGATGTPSSGGTVTYIGSRNTTDRTFDGLIDDVRIYNRQITATEVQSLYDLGASDKVNSSVSQNQGTGRLDSGLVGYWKLDDGSGTTATDSSVNGNNGTLTNGPTWGTGRIGSVLNFFPGGSDTNAYVDIGDPASGVLDFGSGDFTVGFWMKGNGYVSQGSSVNIPVSKFLIDFPTNPGYGFKYGSDNKMAFTIANGSTQYTVTSSTATAGDSQWHYYIGKRLGNTIYLFIDGTSSGSTSVSGSVSSSYKLVFGEESNLVGNRNVNSQIDEVRVYNRALSDDEVSQLYRLTAPTSVDTSLRGYWSFDGSATNWTSSSAGTVSDFSGSGNTGTLTNMNQSTSPVEGKLGQALSFNGTNQYVTAPSTTSLQLLGSFTVSVWFKASADGVPLIGKEDFGGNWYGWTLGIGNHSGSSCGALKVSYMTTAGGGGGSWQCSTAGVSLGTWQHVVWVYNGSVDKIYINGVLDANTPADDAPFASSVALDIGRSFSGNGGYFTGQIDDVRVYNRALSATEVAALYNSGR